MSAERCVSRGIFSNLAKNLTQLQKIQIFDPCHPLWECKLHEVLDDLLHYTLPTMNRGKLCVLHRQSLSAPKVFNQPKALRKVGGALMRHPMSVRIWGGAVASVRIAVAIVPAVATSTLMSGGAGIGGVSLPS